MSIIRLGDIATKESIDFDGRLAEVEVNLDTIMDIDTDVAYLSGSVVEGFGNPTSDVDIFVISEDLKMAECKICSNKDRYYVEFNTYSQETVNMICNNINNIYNNPTYENIVNSNLDELEFYYRMAIGIPIINSEKFYCIKEKFDKNKANFIYERYFAIKYYDNMRLLKLFMNSKIDVEERVYFLAQSALFFALDSVLAQHGEGYKSSKFRFKKICRAFGEHSDIYIKSLKLRSLGDNSIQNYVKDVIEFCNKLNLYNYNISEVQELRFKVLHNPYFVLDSYLIQKKLFVYKVSDEVQFIIKEILNGNYTETSLYKRVNINYGLSYKQFYEIIESLELNDVIKIF